MTENNYTTDLIIGREFPEKVIPLIENARHNIDILVFEWRFYPTQVGTAIQKFNQALIKAQKRGVEIRALIGKPSFSTIQNQQEIEIKTPSRKEQIHAKLMIIDFSTAIIGSHNYSFSAFELNQELSLIIRDPNIIARLLKFFDTING